MLQKLRENRKLQGTLLILPTLLWMIALLIIPLILTVITSVGRRDADGNVIYTVTINNYTRLAGFTGAEVCGETISQIKWWIINVLLWLFVQFANILLEPLSHIIRTTTLSYTPGECFYPLYGDILWRSLTLAFQTTALVILLAYPLAYFVARAPAKTRNTLLFLILVPLWTNFVIRIYAWIMILRTQGVLNGLLEPAFPLYLPLVRLYCNMDVFHACGSGWAAAVLASGQFKPFDFYPSPGAVLVGMVYEFLPFMILPIYTSLEKIDPSLFEAAADLGANAIRTLLRITLPLSMPGVVAGTILVFIPVMGTFVVSDILGGRQVILVGNLVQRQFLDARDPAFGSAASIILMVLTLVVTIFYTRRFGFGEEIASA